MKKFIIIALILLASAASCKSSYPANGPFNESVLMTIDCRNDPGLKQTIVMRLRGTKARNIQITPEGHFLKIKAVFLKREVPPFKLVNLSTDIQNLGGVLQTFMEENKAATVQVENRGPMY